MPAKPDTNKPKMTSAQLIGQLDADFADDEWEQSTHASPEREFMGPDKEYPVRLKTVAFGRKNPSSPLWFRFDFVITREDPDYQGQTISKFITLKESRTKDKRDKLEDLFCDIQLLLDRKIDGISKADLPPLLDELKEIKPTCVVRVNTSSFEGDDGGMVEMKWVNILGQDSSSPAAGGKLIYSEMTNEELALAADANGDTEAADLLSDKLAALGLDPADINEEGEPVFPTWQSVADRLDGQGNAALSDTSDAGKSEPTLGELADQGDQDAIDELMILVEDAEALGCEFPDWDEMTYAEVETHLGEFNLSQRKQSSSAVQSQEESDAPFEPDAPEPTSTDATSRNTASATVLSEADLIELGRQVDEEDSEDACDQLESLCAEYGIDSTSEEYEDWQAVARAVSSAMQDSGQDSGSSDSGSAAIPEKGEVYLYAFRRGISESPCKVTKVLKRDQTVDLKRLEDDKVFEAVAFDKLGQLVE